MLKTTNTIREHIGARERGRRESLTETALAQDRLRSPRNDFLPKLTSEMWLIGELKPSKHAVRKLLPAQIARQQRSIETFGFVAPVLIRGDGEIIKGRTRVEAARQLGLTEVPCLVIDHLSEPEVRTLRITLSRLGETGQWDIEVLKLEVGELLALDAPIEATGLTLPEIDALILAHDPDPALDEAPNVDDQLPVTCSGQMWRLGAHRLVCGDARDPAAYHALLGDEQVRLVLTDVPFNVQIKGHVTSGEHREFAMASGEMSTEAFGDFNIGWMTPCLDHLLTGGLLATFIDWRSVELILACGRGVGFELLNLVVWAKPNGGMGSLWRSRHELLPIFKKPGASHINNIELGRHGRYRSNVWEYPGASSLGSDARKGLADHPTVKPVVLLEDALFDVTAPDDLVLEPFAGSGSTLIACQTTGRRCRAIEIDPLYVDVVVRRWQALTGKPAICEATGKCFDELANEVREERRSAAEGEKV